MKTIPDFPQKTITVVLNLATKLLCEKAIKNPLLDAELLLAYVLKIERVDLYLNRDKKITKQEAGLFSEFLKRRINQEPIAYILGYKEFWKNKIIVNKNVLIPRPETEGIIEIILDIFGKEKTQLLKEKRIEFIKKYNDRLNILDMCTGSGCIIAALAYELPLSKFIGIDLSEIAIQVAYKNILFAKQRVKLLLGDLFGAFETDFKEKFDLITANPPYISEQEWNLLDEDIKKYEPKKALLANEQGLAISKQILQESVYYLKSNGLLLMEIGYKQGVFLKDFAVQLKQYRVVELVKDYSNLDRYILVQKN